MRLLLGQDGAISVEAVPLSAGVGALREPLRVGLAKTAVDSGSVWLYHKTTRRQVYDDARAASPGYDELLLWNERGEVTEACSANVVMQLDGKLVTPPQRSGLLAGTMRERLLRNGRIQESIITLDDLQRGESLWLINSVRKWRTATIF